MFWNKKCDFLLLLERIPLSTPTSHWGNNRICTWTCFVQQNVFCASTFEKGGMSVVSGSLVTWKKWCSNTVEDWKKSIKMSVHSSRLKKKSLREGERVEEETFCSILRLLQLQFLFIFTLNLYLSSFVILWDIPLRLLFRNIPTWRHKRSIQPLSLFWSLRFCKNTMNTYIS